MIYAVEYCEDAMDTFGGYRNTGEHSSIRPYVGGACSRWPVSRTFEGPFLKNTEKDISAFLLYAVEYCEYTVDGVVGYRNTGEHSSLWPYVGGACSRWPAGGTFEGPFLKNTEKDISAFLIFAVASCEYTMDSVVWVRNTGGHSSIRPYVWGARPSWPPAWIFDRPFLKNTEKDISVFLIYAVVYCEYTMDALVWYRNTGEHSSIRPYVGGACSRWPVGRTFEGPFRECMWQECLLRMQCVFLAFCCDFVVFVSLFRCFIVLYWALFRWICIRFIRTASGRLSSSLLCLCVSLLIRPFWGVLVFFPVFLCFLLLYLRFSIYVKGWQCLLAWIARATLQFCDLMRA